MKRGNRIRNRYDKSLENKKEGDMKKHILKSLNLFLLSSLFLSNVSIVHAKVDIKKLKEKFDFVGPARREFENAGDKYNACAKDICQTEKKAAQAAHAEWHRTTYPSIHVGRRARNEFYRAYERSDEIYQSCLKKQCGAAYKEMIQAKNKLSRRVLALVVGIELAVIGTAVGVSLLGALSADAIARGEAASEAANIIKKHKVRTPNERTLLQKFGSTQDLEMLRDKILSPEAVKAAAEIVYNREPSMDEMKNFIKTYNIIEQEPKWQTRPNEKQD